MTSLRTLASALVLLLLVASALSACSSAHSPGADGGAQLDTGALPDAGPYVPTCEPMAARIDPCSTTECAGVSSAFWDGAACVAARCDCLGAECQVYATVAACEAAHASCEAALCGATGGAWFSRPEWCGHFQCGLPPDSFCDQPVPACDCGPEREFRAGEGCVHSDACELTATQDPDVLCASTGGEWMTSICGHASCGRLSDLDCISPGCVCGELEVFDTDRGCVRSAACEVRELGEACTTTGLCADSVCCVTGGISADPSCVAPMCSDPHGVCGPPRP